MKKIAQWHAAERVWTIYEGGVPAVALTTPDERRQALSELLEAVRQDLGEVVDPRRALARPLYELEGQIFHGPGP